MRTHVSGAYLYPLHGRRFNLSCPMLIQDQFPDFNHSSPDAVLTTQANNTYIFKDEHYWVYNSVNQLLPGFPHYIKHGLQGKLPDHLDAALVWPADNDGHTYFFKGDKYWRYSSLSSEDSLPRRLTSIFKHSGGSRKGRLRKWSPKKIDAAIVLPDASATYLVAGDECYKLMEDRMQVVVGYPKKITRVLFNCADYRD